MIPSLTLGPYESAVSMKYAPEFDGASHDANGLTPISGFAPDSLAGEPHRPQAESSHEKIVGDQQLPAEAGRLPLALPWRVLRYVTPQVTPPHIRALASRPIAENAARMRRSSIFL